MEQTPTESGGPCNRVSSAACLFQRSLRLQEMVRASLLQLLSRALPTSDASPPLVPLLQAQKPQQLHIQHQHQQCHSQC